MKHSLLTKKENVLLRVIETIDTGGLATRRSYSTFLVADRTDHIKVDEVVWKQVSAHMIHKTIYVKLSSEDMNEDDLTRTKAFFRAKITLRLAGDKA